MRLFPILLLIVSLYAPLAQAADPQSETQPPSGAASIYVYWVPKYAGGRHTLGLSLLANEQDFGPLGSDECIRIAIPAGEVNLRLVRRPPKWDEVPFPRNAQLTPLSIRTNENGLHYVEFRYHEIVGGGLGPAGGFVVATVEFAEVPPEVALPILSARWVAGLSPNPSLERTATGMALGPRCTKQ